MTSITVDSFVDLKKAIDKKYRVIAVEGELAEKLDFCFKYKNYIIAAFTLAGIAAGAALAASSKAIEILKFAVKASGKPKWSEMMIGLVETMVVTLGVVSVASMFMDYEFERQLEFDPKTGRFVMKYKLKRKLN